MLCDALAVTMRGCAVLSGQHGHAARRHLRQRGERYREETQKCCQALPREPRWVKEELLVLSCFHFDRGKQRAA
jgi:hypothetical protein